MRWHLLAQPLIMAGFPVIVGVHVTIVTGLLGQQFFRAHTRRLTRLALTNVIVVTSCRAHGDRHRDGNCSVRSRMAGAASRPPRASRSLDCPPPRTPSSRYRTSGDGLPLRLLPVFTRAAAHVASGARCALSGRVAVPLRAPITTFVKATIGRSIPKVPQTRGCGWR